VNLSLAGRRALVCGASAGIGRAAAVELACLGATLFPLARSAGTLGEVAAGLTAAGAPRVRPVVADLSDRAGIERTIEALVAEEGPITILVNNTGGPPSGPILDAPEEQFARAFEQHVLASRLLLRLLLPGMRSEGWGRIVNVVSISVREPIAGLGVSNTIRGAMASWAKSVSKELPPGVTINNVLPGYTATERLSSLAEATAARSGRTASEVEEEWVRTIPEGRLGRPEEIGAVIAFLASPAASFVRGQSLAVDGGRLNAI
jgi:3-oxoacyl-[acyl-carrier protein] reductase